MSVLPALQSVMPASPLPILRNGLVMLLLTLLASAVSANDPCNLQPSGNNTVWYGAPSTAMACFNNIPFNETTRQTTLQIMEKVFSFYSFSDIAQANLPPYHLSVRTFSAIFSPLLNLTLTLLWQNRSIGPRSYNPSTHQLMPVTFCSTTVRN